MNPSLITALLWVPFGIVLLIVSAIFLVSGYKRGLWRALISLGATVVSTVLSLVLAKLIAPLISGAILNVLPGIDLSDAALPEDFVLDLVKGIIGVIVSLVLFSVFLFIISIITKSVSNHAAKGKLAVEKKSLKWAGLGVRLVDAVLYSLLLVLPLYGTLATYAPTAQALVNMQDEDTEEASAYLRAVTAHPVVQASGAGPVSWVYSGLSGIEVGGSTVDIAAIATSAEGLISRVDAISKASEEEMLPLVKDLISYTRDNVLDQDWCYDLVIDQVLGQMKQTMQAELPAENQALVEEIFQICEVSKQEFRENGDVLLDFAEYMLENDIPNKEPEELMTDAVFLGELGDLLNSTEQMVSVKNLLIMTAVKENLFGGDAVQAGQFVAEYLGDQATEESARQQEALAFLAILASGSQNELEAALAMHPAIDATDLP